MSLTFFFITLYLTSFLSKNQFDFFIHFLSTKKYFYALKIFSVFLFFFSFFCRNNECQKYLRSLRYIDELQKFVEDNQWKRSLAIEPNQLKPDIEQENQDVLGHLNLSPSKMSAREHARVDRPFVPGHRRAKSDGCGMFMMKHKDQSMSTVQDAYKANYSHHLLDDSKLEEENLKSPSHTLPPNYLSSKKASMERGGPDGVKELLRNPGIKCQHQVNKKFVKCCLHLSNAFNLTRN